MRWLRRLLTLIVVLVGFFAVVQLVPYGRAHSNPPVISEPAWDSPKTRELAVRACFDCHSHQTRWPWYSNVAPFSWVVQRNVENARTVLNFSDWSRPYDLLSQTSQSILSHEMPPRGYRMMHPEAELTDAEKLQLAKGLHATFRIPWRD